MNRSLNAEALGLASQGRTAAHETGQDSFTITQNGPAVTSVARELQDAPTADLAEQVQALSPLLHTPLWPLAEARFHLAAVLLARRVAEGEVAA